MLRTAHDMRLKLELNEIRDARELASRIEEETLCFNLTEDHVKMLCSLTEDLRNFPYLGETVSEKYNFSYEGMPCTMRRNYCKCWTGYVGGLGDLGDKIEYEKIEVHGGITFNSEEKLGFDCNHNCDVDPAGFVSHIKYLKDDIDNTSEYRDYKYVRGQIEKLVDQLNVCYIKIGRAHV